MQKRIRAFDSTFCQFLNFITRIQDIQKIETNYTSPRVRLLQDDVNDRKLENKFQKYLTRRRVSLLFHLWSSSMRLKYPPIRYWRLKTSISEKPRLRI